MKNIFICLLLGSLLGCQTQEFAYRMSIKDSLYRDDSLLAINVLQQLNEREKGDSMLSDSGRKTLVQGPITLLTLTKELRYTSPEEEVVDSTETQVADSVAPKVENKDAKAAATTKPKPKTPTPTSSPNVAPKTILPAPKTPVSNNPPKPVEAAKPATPPPPPPSNSPVKQ